ncbi:NAD(P)H-dependent oxidoreductase [Amycolatopsis sp. PS_44_ISF1]|uniref:FMN-dependent NADH-azoreductase n=1 Tax=Amycolatopsis sp. PS_44_ISF1 TaxID=2974917 RepID=UPI0028DE2FB5|nr:NAD(P)H-dependent oxidoreductase [Amycolatopsis sp. PS_44_ISF1]MDT8915934.1 NAD(P)H-dependent oxidoreductase [Amycolatopsis sp. PS_44_ISF1]
MAHLLHLDSSITGDRSVSRKLTARAADAWRAAHPGGTVVHRDLARDPLPHLDAESGLARAVPAEQHTPAQEASWRLTEELVGEVREATTVLLGLPLYNFGAPSVVKSWLDHLIAPGLSVDPATRAGLLGGREFLVLATRGGGYGEGTPRAGWDHAEAWLPHAFSQIGLEPRFIVTELTLAESTPAMAGLRGLAAENRAASEREIDALWAPAHA